jgi:hypothetical protein
VAQDHLLEADAGTEAERPRAEATDGAGCHLQDDHLAGGRDPGLGVDRPLDQAERRRCCPDGGVDGGDDRRRVAGRRDVDRLLEVRAVEGVRLVERGEDPEPAPVEERLDRHLDARHERLHDDGRVGRGAGGRHDPAHPGRHLHGVGAGVGPDHPRLPRATAP